VVERPGPSRQAVRDAGPHQGTAPESRTPAPQRGYESAQRVSSRACVSGSRAAPESGFQVCPSEA